MKYVSTRGDSRERRFSEVLMEGLAPDGGLYMPLAYPKVDDATLRRWRALSYPELAFEILSLYIDDICAEELRAMVREVARAPGYLKPPHFLAMFRFVRERAYERGSFRDFLAANG